MVERDLIDPARDAAIAKIAHHDEDDKTNTRAKAAAEKQALQNAIDDHNAAINEGKKAALEINSQI